MDREDRRVSSPETDATAINTEASKAHSPSPSPSQDAPQHGSPELSIKMTGSEIDSSTHPSSVANVTPRRQSRTNGASTQMSAQPSMNDEVESIDSDEESESQEVVQPRIESDPIETEHTPPRTLSPHNTPQPGTAKRMRDRNGKLVTSGDLLPVLALPTMDSDNHTTRRSGRLASRQRDTPTPDSESDVVQDPEPEPVAPPAPSRRNRLTAEEKARREEEKARKAAAREAEKLEKARIRQEKQAEKARQKEEKAREREAEKQEKARLRREKARVDRGKKNGKQQSSNSSSASAHPTASAASTARPNAPSISVETPVPHLPGPNVQVPQVKWTSLPAPSSPVPASESILDELRTSSPELDRTPHAPDHPMQHLPPSFEAPPESTQDTNQDVPMTPLFFLGSSQFPTAVRPLHNQRLPAQSAASGSDVEGDVPPKWKQKAVARKPAAVPYRRLTQLASQDMLFSSPSPNPLHPPPSNQTKRLMESDVDDEDDESSDTGSDSDASQSHIPRNRRAGAGTRPRRSSGLLGLPRSRR